MKGANFGTVINCMDGRTQEPVSRWMRGRLSLDYVDTITEPGADLVLLEGKPDVVAALKRKLDISIRKHGSKVVAVVGHHDCAGNPVEKDAHLGHIRDSVRALTDMRLGVRVIGLWVGEDWRVEKIEDTEGAE